MSWLEHPSNPRTPELEELGVLEGEWDVELSGAFFLEGDGVQQRGVARWSWIGDAFLRFEGEMEGERTWDAVFGRSDANGQLYALYHDPRPTSRLFRATFAGGHLELLREDPDFHQRWLADVTPDRVTGHWDMSEDQGRTWRKDFDLTFLRRTP